MDDMTPDVDSMALEKILGDMDDMESKRVYGEQPTEGVSITIDVAPKKAEEKKEEEPMPESPADDDMKMPPFLRKLK